MEILMNNSNGRKLSLIKMKINMWNIFLINWWNLIQSEIQCSVMPLKPEEKIYWEPSKWRRNGFNAAKT